MPEHGRWCSGGYLPQTCIHIYHVWLRLLMMSWLMMSLMSLIMNCFKWIVNRLTDLVYVCSFTPFPLPLNSFKWIANLLIYLIYVCSFAPQYPPKWCTYSAVWLLHGWCHVKLLSSRQMFCVHIIQPCIVSRHFMQSHIRRDVNACLAVTCRLRFGKNERDLLRATAVTRGWNGYENMREMGN